LWQFSVWNWKCRQPFRLAAVALLVLWMTENVVLQKMFVFGSVFPITFSLLMVILAAVELSRQITPERNNLLTTPKFMICCGAILFHTYRIIVECFYIQGIAASEGFLANIFTILTVVNVIVNLLYALVILWIPEKKKFTLPYY
jgi:hypothetical protein